MAEILEIIATPYFAVVDFALAAPATAVVIATAAVAAYLAIA
jgi:hypothetical protein